LRHLIFPVLFAVFVALAFVQKARACNVTDATGLISTIPDAPARVFAAGSPASVLLCALATEAMVGWLRAPRARLTCRSCCRSPMICAIDRTFAASVTGPADWQAAPAVAARSNAPIWRWPFGRS
jgi:hypothetical protein